MPRDQLVDPTGQALFDLDERGGELLRTGVEVPPISASGTPVPARVRTWTSRSRSADP
jgi:hypothetical protein